MRRVAFGIAAVLWLLAVVLFPASPEGHAFLHSLSIAFRLAMWCSLMVSWLLLVAAACSPDAAPNRPPS